MNVKIMSEMECVRHTHSQDVKPCIIISINCYSDREKHDLPYLYNNPNVKGVLRLFFDDVQPRYLNKHGRLRAMDETDVNKIYEFIKDWMGLDIEEIIVHCHAGISRSSAVACGICLWFNQDDMWIWNNGRYVPNKWIVDLMTKNTLTTEEKEFRYEVNEISREINDDWKHEILNEFIKIPN